MVCPLYRDLRCDIFGPNIQNIKSLLFGNPDDNNESNTTLFLKVHEFIEKSKRFNWLCKYVQNYLSLCNSQKYYDLYSSVTMNM